ncbi:helix-turn-helix domain-containing protein [Nocardia sp. NBC_01388]|uniref:helix-turn-helix domain-containing protein n=1 Tax=Nocardia sp. NBC_01388 TaxID=2903596 RepID=UPI00325250FF
MDHRILTAGERIELRRRRLGLSRRVVAQLSGRSEEWLRQVEVGRCRLDSIEMATRLAEVLHFDSPMELVGWSALNRPIAHDVGLDMAPLTRAVMNHPSVHPDIDLESGSPTIDSVHDGLEQCWQVWLGSPGRYTELAARLPRVLVAARVVRAAAQSDSTQPVEESGRLLVDAYQLARLLFTRVGEHNLAWLVADRPIGILARNSEPLAISISCWHMAGVLLAMGYHAESFDYAVTASKWLRVNAGDDKRAAFVDGALLLVAAEAAAARLDADAAAALLAQAGQLADELGPNSSDRRVRFGAKEIAITGMDIDLRLGRVDDAIRLAAETDIPDESAIDVRVGYFLTTAYAYSLRGEDFAAVFALQQVERACSEDIRYDWRAHRTLQKLARHDHHLIRRDLAKLLALATLG